VTRKVQDCLHVDFLENQENQKGKGPDRMFDLELLTPSMNYIPSSMVKDFEELMQKEFKMSSMGELTFFLGLQVKQTSAESLQRSSHACDKKDLLDDQLQEDVNILEEDWVSWQMQETQQFVAISSLQSKYVANPQLQVLFSKQHRKNIVLSSHSRAALLQGIAARYSAEIQGTADSQGTAEAQGTADIPQSPNDYTPIDESQTSGGDEDFLELYSLKREWSNTHALWVKSQNLKKQKKQRKKQKKKVSSVKMGRNKDESILSQEHHDQDDHHHTAFIYEDVDATEAIFTPNLERKSDETEEVLIEEGKDAFDVKKTRGLSIPGPMQSQPQQPTQATDPKEKGKGILVEEPKKKKLTLQQIRALETTNDEEVARKVQAEWDAEEERKRLEALKKPKTISKKPTSLAQERNHMMSFLKGQGYKNIQKLKESINEGTYDKVQESSKSLSKDFILIGSEKEKQVLQERDAKRLLRKRKATVTEEQPSKKIKLRTKTIDELKNYLRIVDFEKSAQDRESLEAISMITEFKVIDSPDGEYLMIYRANTHFRAFDTLWEILHILDRQ
ncbi:hypothetical protein Tco_0734960, partial [Tanacetum coccineum]